MHIRQTTDHFCHRRFASSAQASPFESSCGSDVFDQSGTRARYGRTAQPLFSRSDRVAAFSFQHHKQCRTAKIARCNCVMSEEHTQETHLRPSLGTSMSEMAFHEKAGRSQVDSSVFLVNKFFLPPSRHCRHASIRTLEERIVSLGAHWAFSFQPVLPSVGRPLVSLKSGTGPRPLTQSPELGFGGCLFSFLERFGSCFAVLF